MIPRQIILQVPPHARIDYLYHMTNHAYKMLYYECRSRILGVNQAYTEYTN